MTMPDPGMPSEPGAAQEIEARLRRGVFLAAAITLVTLVAGAFVALRTGLLNPRLHPDILPVLAVLPLENLGAPDDDYFADGLTAELTGRLARLDGIAVIARASAVPYKRSTTAYTRIAEELGADYLMVGTVRWEKDVTGAGVVRLEAKLVRVEGGTHVWEDHYSTPYGPGLFDVLGKVAAGMADALRQRGLGVPRRAAPAVPTLHLDAYDAYLRGLAKVCALYAIVATVLFSLLGVKYALFLGLMAGVGGAYLLEILNAGFTTPRQVEDMLELPLLASLAKMDPASGGRGGAPLSLPEYPLAKPLARFSESVRSLRSAIQMSDVDSPPKVLQITSTVPNEGKTTIALMIAASAAHSGQRVLVIDCDLRRPSASSVLGLEKAAGLVEYLTGEADLQN